MSTGMWLNKDNLPLQYGTQKANPAQGGDFWTLGQTRVMETLIDLTSLGSTAQVQDMNAIFPAGYNVFVEKVEVEMDVASASGTSFSVGLGYFTPGTTTYNTITTNAETSTASGISTQAYTASMPAVTSISDTAFVSALVNASTNAAGDLVTLTAGSSSAGGYIGAQSTTTTHPNYITAKASGTYTTGLARIRVFYRGYGTIIN